MHRAATIGTKDVKCPPDERCPPATTTVLFGTSRTPGADKDATSCPMTVITSDLDHDSNLFGASQREHGS